MLQAIALANCFEHYSTALYGYLAPFMRISFLPTQEIGIAFALIYALSSISILAKPFGIVLFHQVIRFKGIKFAFILSIIGVIVTDFFLSILPFITTSLSLLLLFRFLQIACSASGNVIAEICLFNFIKKNNKISFVSFLYHLSSIAGILLASLVPTLILNIGGLSNQHDWRYFYFFCLPIGLFSLFLIKKNNQFENLEKSNFNIPQSITFFNQVKDNLNIFLQNKFLLINLILNSALTYATYSFPFNFIDYFMPVITNDKVNIQNTTLSTNYFLFLDFIFFIIFAKLIKKEDKIYSKILFYSPIFLSMILPIYFFFIISMEKYFMVNIAKLTVVACGVVFSISFTIQKFIISKKFGTKTYIILGLSYIIGSELLGKTLPTISWSLWHFFKNPFLPIIYMSLICFCAALGNIRSLLKEKGYTYLNIKSFNI